MKKEQLKVAVIGGGSSYTPELVEGFIKHYDEFPVKELYLVDIEAGKEKLDIIAALAKRMVEKSGVPMTIKATLDRREAIDGADFVSTQLRVGLLDARARDESIPLKHGLIGQETTGAGGFAKAIRTIPVILDICRDIRELSPDAFLLNFTNPAGIVTEAVLNYGKVKTIGLCNLPIGTRMQIAKLFEVDVSKVYIEMVGLNHLNWTTRIFVDGIEVTDSFLKKTAASGGFAMKNIPDLGWDPEFIRSIGAIPCSYHRYYYMKDQLLEHQLKEFEKGITRAVTVKQVESELFELYKDPNLNIKPPQLEKRGGAYYSEVAVNLMTSIYNNRKDIQTVNVRNNGILPFLPDNACVELNAVIDADGAHPIQPAAPIGPQIRGLLQAVKAYEELTVEAAVHGSYDAAWQALTLHPLVGSATTAKLVLDEIVAENREFLPQF